MHTPGHDDDACALSGLGCSSARRVARACAQFLPKLITESERESARVLVFHGRMVSEAYQRRFA